MDSIDPRLPFHLQSFTGWKSVHPFQIHGTWSWIYLFSIWLRSSTHRCLFTLYNFLFLILSIVIEFKFRILIGRETKRVKSSPESIARSNPLPSLFGDSGKRNGILLTEHFSPRLKSLMKMQIRKSKNLPKKERETDIVERSIVL